MSLIDQHYIDARAAVAAFSDSLLGADHLEHINAELIGNDAVIEGPFGPRQLLYADYVASGRALGTIERFVYTHVLPYYANSHTEASFCGGAMTGFRRAARDIVAKCCAVDQKRYAVIFSGSGATAGLNRLVNLLGITAAVSAGQIPLVITGPYEHHSNILPWRESGAEVVEVKDQANGEINLEHLDQVLSNAGDRLVICAFSAASNVTGIITDIAAVTRRAKSAGAKMVVDFAGGGPYLPIQTQPAPDLEIDALVISPHKFIGGPGSTGVLIVRRDAVVTNKPTLPGGGTVKFVTPVSHDYSDSLEAREEAGTPNVIGDIRAALAFLVKDAIGATTMSTKNAAMCSRALSKWRQVEQLELLGEHGAERLPIFSFRIRDGKGDYIHHQLITRMLSDRFGIQARGGCACAGPYVHRLLNINQDQSDALRLAIANGDEISKPGFVRLNFSVLLSDEKVDYIIDAVARIAADAATYSKYYAVDTSRAIFYPRSDKNASDEALPQEVQTGL